MLFHISWEFTERSEASQRRALDLFARWQSPVELREFHGYADGGGGMAIVETDSAATLAQITAPWTPWLRYTVRVLVPVAEVVPLMEEAAAFRGSV
jgi:hypothetical protein